MPRGLVHVAGSKRCVLSHPCSRPSQTILEIRIRRGGISIQGPPVLALPGSPYFYTMHGCGSLPSAADENPHTQLPRRLAHSGPVASGFNIAQDPPPQPLTLPGAQGQLCQEHTVTQPASFVPGHSYRQFSATRLPSRKGPSVRSKLSRECRALWQRLRRYFGLFLLHMRPIQFWLKQRVPSMAWIHVRHRVTVTRACVSALAHWRNLFWLKQGETLDTAHRRKVVTTTF